MIKEIINVPKTNADICLDIYNTSKPFIKNFRTAIDVGCRDGDFTRPMSKDFQNVNSFDYRDRIKNKANNVKYFKYALGDKETDVKAFNGVITENRDGVSSSIVEQKTLDSFNFENVDYIKIDVEGHELKVLKGAINTINKYSPLIVVEENGSAEKWNKGTKNEALNYLQELGYKIVAQERNDYILEKK